MSDGGGRQRELSPLSHRERSLRQADALTP